MTDRNDNTRNGYPRWQWVVVIASIGALAMMVSVYQASDPDLFIMLATGRQIAETGHIPGTDNWSHTAYGNPWMNHEWLSSIMTYGLFRLWGIGGIILVKAALLTLAYLALASAAALAGATPFFTLLTAVISLLAANYGFGERMQVISFFLLSLLLLLLEYGKARGLSIRAIMLLLAGLFAGWANLHLGFHFGLLVLGAYLTEEMWGGMRGRGWQEARVLSLGLLTAILATGINPKGFELTLWPIKLLYQKTELYYDQLVSRTIYEYQPLFSAPFTREPFVKYGKMLLVFISGGFLLNINRTRLSYALLTVFLGYLTILSSRYLWFLALVALPGTARNWSLGWQHLISQLTKKFPRTTVFIQMFDKPALFGLVVLVLIGAASFQRSGQHLWQRMELRWRSRMFSEAGTGFLKRHLGNSKIFNDFDIGGYLIWKRIPVFADGRISPYKGTTVLEDHYRIFQGDLQLLDRYGVDWIVLPFSTAGQLSQFEYFNRRLDASGNWALVFWDDAFLIYVRNAPAYRELIDSLGYKVNPALMEFDQAPEVFRQAMDRKLAEDPGAKMPHVMYGNYFFAHGLWDESEEHFRLALRGGPDDAVLYNNLGNIMLKRGRASEAVKMYKKAVKLDVNLGLAYCNWGFVMETLGHTKEAVRLYTIATKVTPGDAWPYNRLGMIEARRGNRYQALEYWRQGAAIDPQSEAAYNLQKVTGIKR